MRFLTICMALLFAMAMPAQASQTAPLPQGTIMEQAQLLCSERYHNIQEIAFCSGNLLPYLASRK